MNAFNRILVVLTVLIAIPICMALFVLPGEILDAAANVMDGVSTWLRAMPWYNSWYIRLPLGILFALAWLAVCLFVLVLELRRPKQKMVCVEAVGGGNVELSLKTIADRVQYDVDQLPGVLRTQPTITARRGGVVVEVEVDMAGDFQVPTRASHIVEVVRQAVEERLGVKLARPPKVKLRAAPAPAPQPPAGVSPPQ